MDVLFIWDYYRLERYSGRKSPGNSLTNISSVINYKKMKTGDTKCQDVPELNILEQSIILCAEVFLRFCYSGMMPTKTAIFGF